MGFSAASVARLEYDFRNFPRDGVPGEKCTGVGVIPEPSTDALKKFFEDVQGALGEAQTGDSDAARTVLEAVAALCSGKPSVEELSQLPPRIGNEFAQYLLGAFSPKA